MDQTAGGLTGSVAKISSLILNSQVAGLTLSIDNNGKLIISNHSRVYADKTVAVTGATITPSPAMANPAKLGIYYDQQSRAGGAVSYQQLKLPTGAGATDSLYASATNPYRHFVCLLTVPTPATSPGSGGSGTGPGTGGTPGGGGGILPPSLDP
jgi:hypothetical protein